MMHVKILKVASTQKNDCWNYYTTSLQCVSASFCIMINDIYTLC